MIVLVAVWVDPGAPTTRPRSRRPTARRCATRSPTRCGRRPPTTCARSPRAARRRRTPTTRAAEPCGSPSRRGRGATASPLDPPFRAAWDPVPRTRARGGARDRARRRRDARATRAATTCPTRRCSSGCSSASTRAGPRSCASCARPSTSTAGGRGCAEVAVWDLVARRARRAAVAAARRPHRADPRLRLERRARRAGGARAARARRCATPACGRSSSASTTPTGATTSRSSRRCATPSAARRGAAWSTPTTAGGWPATARAPWDVADGDRRAPGRSSRSASTGSRSRCRRTTSRATRGCGPATSLRLAAGEMVRSLHEARDLVLRGGVDVVQPDVVLAGGHRRLPADRRRSPDLCGRMLSPHTWSNGLGLLANLHLALAVSTCPFLEVPLDPPGWTPAAARLAARRRRGRRSRRTGRSRRRPGPASASTPDLEALEAHRVA